jgi:uncharacterized protein involved in exopolysaccharide biosynthesis/cellulose biosynthesis protein BcsQ
LSSTASTEASEIEPPFVGDPVLAQIRDFIDGEPEQRPPTLDPIGLVRRTIRGREWRIFALSLLVSIIAATSAYLLIKPIYQSSGMVRVLPREAKILYSDQDDSRLRLYDAYVSAEMELIQSRPVLEDALTDLYKQGNKKYTLPEDVGNLSSMFSVSGKKGLISVATRSGEPLLSAAAVNAVLSAYQASNESARQKHFDIRRAELNSREMAMESKLAKLKDDYLEIGGEHDAITLSKAHVAKTAQLEVLEERIAELDNTIAQLQATGGVGADVGSVEIQRATLLDQATADMTYERAQRLAALGTLKKRYQPSHPKLAAAEDELSILEATIAERREQIATLGKAGALTGGNSASKEESLAELETLKNKLTERRQTLRSEAADLNYKLIRIRGIVTETDRLEELLDETKRALDAVMLESQNDLSRAIEIIAFGKVPDSPIEDKRKPAALGAFVFGGLGTLAFFVFGKILGGRVRYSDELDQRSSELLATVIPENKNDNSGMLMAAGRLRNELDLRWPRKGSPPLVIGVVGVSLGAGASSVVKALGQHYSQAERSVLIIDANPCENGLSQSFEVTTGTNPQAVARGNVTLQEAVHHLPSDGGPIRLLGSTSLAPDGANLQESVGMTVDEIQNLLANARTDYDTIILDLGILSAGSQSAIGAVLADRVVAITACDEQQQTIRSTVDLLSRLAPDRFVLALNRGNPLDPQLATNRTHRRAFSKAQVNRNL